MREPGLLNSISPRPGGRIDPLAVVLVAALAFAGAYVGQTTQQESNATVEKLQSAGEHACDKARQAFMTAPRDTMDYAQTKHIAQLDRNVRRECGY